MQPMNTQNASLCFMFSVQLDLKSGEYGTCCHTQAPKVHPLSLCSVLMKWITHQD